MPRPAGVFTSLYVNCTVCGAPVDLSDYMRNNQLQQIMKKEHICYFCAYWKNRIENPTPYQQIIEGKCWEFNPWEEDKSFLVQHNKISRYIMCNDGTSMRSNNAIYQGDVPSQFKTLLPDTARWITKAAYYRIKMHPFFECKSKGCWDRYHCYWYDPASEIDGPWNEIPEEYQIGDEGCESFLHKSNVFK